jgi:hypothetical protein
MLFCILDAKYFKFGITGIPADLPDSGSINKQITYGEYIHTKDKFREKYGQNVPVFNAFLMPYNSTDNVFGIFDKFTNIGEASSDWKAAGNGYERVQGILVDIRYLMYHYVGNHKTQISMLVQSIMENFNINGDELTDADDEGNLA